MFFFTPTVVNTGADLILFDTGWKAADTFAALAKAGYTPDQIDVVVLTHMHPDHIGGLMVNGSPAYPNARYVTGATEYDDWDMLATDGVPILVITCHGPVSAMWKPVTQGIGVSVRAAFLSVIPLGIRP